jgi:cytochrome c peroxidase
VQIAADSRFDRALRGEAELSAKEKRGFELFMTEHDPARGKFGADCFHCHGGALFTDFGLRNNGLDLVSADAGRALATAQPGDRGKFKTPSLRNVALTAPYMHDGSLATLDDVLDHYAAGGTVTSEGPNAGDGRLSPNKSLFVHGFELTPERRAELRAFLDALTDDALLRDPRFADPWLTPM